MTWLTLALALAVVLLLVREAVRRRAESAVPRAAPVAPEARAVAKAALAHPREAALPAASPGAAAAGSSLAPARMHRHESVVGGALSGSATTLFVVHVEAARGGAGSPIALAMLVGSRLVAATAPSGRVTHFRDSLFLITVEGIDEEATSALVEKLQRSIADTPVVSSTGAQIEVRCSVSFARFAPGDPALEHPNLEGLVELTGARATGAGPAR